jgi:hypothetical protein
MIGEASPCHALSLSSETSLRTNKLVLLAAARKDATGKDQAKYKGGRRHETSRIGPGINVSREKILNDTRFVNRR